MKLVKLLHNPGAGDGYHSAEELATTIAAGGFHCSYATTKEAKQNGVNPEHVDLVALAGGDGTIRKIAKQLLEEDVPIGLFPMGTANNIARTLQLPTDPAEIVSTWQRGHTKEFDIGVVSGMGERAFFLEGLGFGVFPLLMDAMKSEDKKSDEPKKKIRTAQEMLIEIVGLAAPTRCDLIVDGRNYSGRFLLVEIMNIKSIGPNLNLSPGSDPGDGLFEVVLIAEEQRQDFIEYLSNKTHGREKRVAFNILHGKDISILWEGTSLHIDDEKKVLETPATLNITIQPGAFRFLVP